MKKARNYLILLLLLVILNSCITSPGIKEPLVKEYTILDGVEASCNIPGVDEPCDDIPVTKMVGFSCVGPRDKAKVSNHHEELHEKINEGEVKP